jgi:hypothetical protein
MVFCTEEIKWLDVSLKIAQSVSLILSRALLGNATTINVDSPDLTRKFIGTIAEITRNSYNTHLAEYYQAAKIKKYEM